MSKYDFLALFGLLFASPACATPLEATGAPASPIAALETAAHTTRFDADALASGASSTAARRTRREFDARLASAQADRPAP